jgi:hypothetical protein
MLQATERCETSHSMVHAFLPASTNRVEMPWEESADLAEPSFSLPSSIRTAHLLVIGDNLRRIAQQLCGVFPGPIRRMHFAGTGHVGLEHVRAYSPEVILLDLGGGVFHAHGESRAEQPGCRPEL